MSYFRSFFEFLGCGGELSDIVEGQFPQKVLLTGLGMSEVGDHVIRKRAVDCVLLHDLLLEGIAFGLAHHVFNINRIIVANIYQ